MALDRDGAERWVVEAPRLFVGGPTLDAEGRLYVGTGDGRIIVISDEPLE